MLQWLRNKIKNQHVKCEPSDAVLKSAKKAVTTYQNKLQNYMYMYNKVVSYLCFSCLPKFSAQNRRCDKPPAFSF